MDTRQAEIGDKIHFAVMAIEAQTRTIGNHLAQMDLVGS